MILQLRMSSHPPLPIYCINLDSRPERWADFQKAFDPLGLKYERFPAIRGPTGIDGCRDSHLAVVQKAKDLKLPWVCVMEDDCEPYPEFAEEFPKILETIWKTPNWYLFQGGGMEYTSISRIHNQLLRIEKWACTHFMIIHSRAYDTLLTSYDYKKPEPLDHYYRRYPTITWAPMLTYQRPCDSDVQIDGSLSFSDQYEINRRKINMFKV
jgi:hypothetical protein